MPFEGVVVQLEIEYALIRSVDGGDEADILEVELLLLLLLTDAALDIAGVEANYVEGDPLRLAVAEDTFVAPIRSELGRRRLTVADRSLMSKVRG